MFGQICSQDGGGSSQFVHSCMFLWCLPCKKRILHGRAWMKSRLRRGTAGGNKSYGGMRRQKTVVANRLVPQKMLTVFGERLHVQLGFLPEYQI